jgi:molybdate transport system regulatory protein
MNDAASSSSDPPHMRLSLRLYVGEEVVIGRGKAQLLELIRDTGSISAAGRAMAMSYRRAWNLVEAMNRTFASPLVESVRGGPKGGGARLTEAGEKVLRHFRAIEAAALKGGGENVTALMDMLRAGGEVSRGDIVDRK